MQNQLKKHLLIASLALSGSAQICVAEGEQLSYMPNDKTVVAKPMFLQGGVQTTERIPTFPQGYTCPRINGFSAYQQAWYALGQKQYQLAADTFQVAGDQMEATGGQTHFLAEARFAEAQTRRLMGQYDRASDLYKRAVAVFANTDPRSYYMRAALDALKDLEGKVQHAPLKASITKVVPKPTPKLIAMPIPGLEKVSNWVPLSAHVTRLDTGVELSTLHNGDFFNRSRGTIPLAAGVDISDEFAKDVVHKAFLKMNCQETSNAGATHYSAPLFYKPILADGKPLAVGAGNDLLSPTAELKLNGKMYKVPMDLPHISPNSRNVMLMTDDRHVLAIDPRTSEAWQLQVNFAKKIPDFNWSKLGRDKRRKFS